MRSYKELPKRCFFCNRPQTFAFGFGFEAPGCPNEDKVIKNAKKLNTGFQSDTEEARMWSMKHGCKEFVAKESP